MVQKLSKQEFFSLIVVIILLFVNNAVANMLIPSYGAVELEFGIPEAWVAIPDGLFTLVSAGFALLWGYYVDKVDRAKVIIAGGFCWSFGTVVTGFSPSFLILVLSRMVTGVGMGCVLPAGYSILSDTIPEEERSGYFGNLAILSSISNGAGQGLSSFIAPLFGPEGWRFPFFFMAVVSFGVMSMLFFVKFPKRGTREGELKALKDLNLEYNFAISRQDLKAIFAKKTNRRMAIAGFFAIIPGTIIIFFLTTVFRTDFFMALPQAIALQTSAIFAAMVGIGYLVGNSALGGIGDFLFKKNRKNRVRLGTLALFLTIPGCLIMLFSMQRISPDFVAAQNYPNPIPPAQVLSLVFSTIFAIFSAYPSYVFFLIFAIVGSFFSAGATANRNAILLDVNLPEHRGTATSFFNLAEQIGKGITLLLAGMLIALVGSTHDMMIISIFFYIPTGILWWKMMDTTIVDMDERSMVLRERQQMSVIDYIFELEIHIDGALQKVHDTKALINTNLLRAIDNIDEAYKIFSDVEIVARERNMEDVQEKATKFKDQTQELLGDLQTVLQGQREGDMSVYPELSQVQLKIDEFPRSDLGKIEILYDTGYLKVVESRLERKSNDVKALEDLEIAIKTFERVERLLNERLESQAYEGEDEPLRTLLEKARRSKENTERLRDSLRKIFEELSQAGIQYEDLKKMTALAIEYEVPIQEVLDETLDPQEASIIQTISNEIDAIFRQYDQWEAA
ncbi:MAG TPA: MFS transporter [Candidatus Lokiarchaeia archaeon]|nr:MFS transporter [Candidatus Lokiarchaeia archaeon]